MSGCPGMSDWAVAGQQQKLQVAELALMEKQADSTCQRGREKKTVCS